MDECNTIVSVYIGTYNNPALIHRIILMMGDSNTGTFLWEDIKHGEKSKKENVCYYTMLVIFFFSHNVFESFFTRGVVQNSNGEIID